jgi:hypothetical protein
MSVKELANESGGCAFEPLVKKQSFKGCHSRKSAVIQDSPTRVTLPGHSRG